MRLGVGITTRLPRDLVGFERQAFERLTPELTDLVVVHDDDPGYTEVVQSLKNSRYEIPQRLGIARAKNMCLKELAGCDYIILLDDDIWPVAPDWAALLIRAHEVSGIHHFVYVPETGVQDRPWATHFEPLKTFHYDGLSITSFNNCTGWNEGASPPNPTGRGNYQLTMSNEQLVWV